MRCRLLRPTCCPSAHPPSVSTRFASASSIVSVPCRPTMERPSGRPSMVAIGMESCGRPASPAMHSRHMAWLRYSTSILSTGVPSSGAARGEVGRQSTSPGPSSRSMRALTSARRALAWRQHVGRHGRRPFDALLDAGPEPRPGLAHPGADARPHLRRLDGAERLEPGDKAVRRNLDLPAFPDKAFEPCHRGRQRGPRCRLDEREGVARRSATAQALGRCAVLASSTRPTVSRMPASRANQPTTSKLGPNGTASSSETRPCVGRSPMMPQ